MTLISITKADEIISKYKKQIITAAQQGGNDLDLDIRISQYSLSSR